MPEIISYSDRDKSTLHTAERLGVKKIANILTALVVLMALPITVIAVQQVNTIQQRAASQGKAKITTATLQTTQIPWVVSVVGERFTPFTTARIYDNKKQWGKDLQVIYENSTRLTIQLHSVLPPSECIVGQTCTFEIELVDPENNTSTNRIPLEIN